MLLEYGLKLNKDIKFISRFWTIVETLFSYGFQELAGDIHPFRRFFVKKRPELVEKTREEKLCLLLEELGPTFVKFGQILSTRKDLIGEKYANALKRLTDNVEPFSMLEAVDILEQELGGNFESFFSSFDQIPFAAGSIAQVHKATLIDGTKVVVKIQRPNISKIIREDLEIMLYLAKRLELSKTYISRFHPYEIVEEFAYSLKRELDYTIETANMNKFATIMANCPGIKVPKYFENCCTSKVLTMELIDGISVSKLLEDKDAKEKYDFKLIAQRGVNAMFSQVFEHAFFHADPHPGNLFICPNNEIAFIDFGMMGRLSSQDKKNFVRAIFALIANDIPTLTSTALKLTISDEVVGNISSLEREIANLVDHNLNQPLDKLSMASILDELMGILDRYQLALKPSLYLMCKALAMVESVGKTLDPSLKLVEMLKPYILKLKRQSFNQVPRLKRFLYNLDDELDELARLPIAVKNILTQAEKGQFSLHLEHHHLDDIEETFYVATEHLSRALLLTALLIGSSLIIVAKIPPYWNNIPIIGAAGFLGSALVSFYVLYMDHRQRKKFLRQKALKKMEARFLNRD